MTQHITQSDDRHELASLYLCGALDGPARASVEAAINGGDAELIDAIRALEGGVLALAALAPPQHPPTEMRARIMGAIAGADGPQVWREWGDDVVAGALFTLRAEDGDWEDTGVPGVEVRRLFVDRESNRMTAMFRMAPGSSYPEHHHDGYEECYVLHGDLHVGDELTMHAGDFQRAEPGSPHSRQWTTGGCVLLVSTSLSDEMD